MAITKIILMGSLLFGKLFSKGFAPQKRFLFKFGGLNLCELDKSTDQITMMSFAFEVEFFTSVSTSCPCFMVIEAKYNFKTIASSVRAKLGRVFQHFKRYFFTEFGEIRPYLNRAITCFC